MTTYYYLSSSKDLPKGFLHNGVLHEKPPVSVDANEYLTLIENEQLTIGGLQYPIQIEIYNGITEPSEAQSLFHYIQDVFKSEMKCVVQVACFVNSNRASFKMNHHHAKKISKLVPEDLLLSDGEVISITKGVQI